MSQAGAYDSGTFLSDIETLTGNAGGAIGPSAVGNVNFTGAGNIYVTGTSGTNSLAITLVGTTDHAIQLGNATASLTSLALGTATQILQSGGADADPAWSTTTYPATSAIGDVIYGSAANTLSSLAFDATATRYLSNTGGGATIPAWDQVELTNGVSGILPVANGGTGVASPTDHSLLVGSGVAAMDALGVATNGQLVIGSSAADPVLATLTAGAGVAIANAAGSITISSSGGGIASWVNATGATQAMAADTGYVANRVAGVLAFTLPATIAVGKVLAIAGSQNGWSIAQNAGQTIHFLGADSTPGVGGSLASTTRYDCIEMICNVANTDLVVRHVMGNITIV